MNQPNDHPKLSLARRSAATLALPLVSTLVVSLICLLLEAHVVDIVMPYLAAVMVSAVWGGMPAALAAVALSLIAYNFLFVAPAFGFAMPLPNELLLFVIFTAVATLTATLVSRLRLQVARSRAQEQVIRALYEFTSELSRADTSADVAATIARHATHASGRPSRLVLVGASGLVEDTELPPADGAALSGLVALGAMAQPIPLADADLFPLASAQSLFGVLWLGGRTSHTDSPLLLALIEQGAAALDRARLVEESAEVALAREREHLQNALLSSLSHDLRTPLASITGAVTSLRQLGGKMSADSRADLLASIEEEAFRLTRFVTNLFDMSRLEGGALRPVEAPVDPIEIIDGLKRAWGLMHPGHLLQVVNEAPDRMARCDAGLLEHALLNLIDNAGKYGAATPVIVRLRPLSDRMAISVENRGTAIPAAEVAHVFEKFYRHEQGESRPAGTGLGLSIARGFVEAMGGRLDLVSPGPWGNGAVFTITLPMEPELEEIVA